MSAIINTTQNPDESWTATGSYNGITVEATSSSRIRAATALSNALYASEGAKLEQVHLWVEEAWKACPDDGLEWLTDLREKLKTLS